MIESTFDFYYLSNQLSSLSRQIRAIVQVLDILRRVLKVGGVFWHVSKWVNNFKVPIKGSEDSRHCNIDLSTFTKICCKNSFRKKDNQSSAH